MPSSLAISGICSHFSCCIFNDCLLPCLFGLQTCAYRALLTPNAMPETTPEHLADPTSVPELPSATDSSVPEQVCRETNVSVTLTIAIIILTMIMTITLTTCNTTTTTTVECEFPIIFFQNHQQRPFTLRESEPANNHTIRRCWVALCSLVTRCKHSLTLPMEVWKIRPSTHIWTSLPLCQ